MIFDKNHKKHLLKSNVTNKIQICGDLGKFWEIFVISVQIIPVNHPHINNNGMEQVNGARY